MDEPATVWTRLSDQDKRLDEFGQRLNEQDARLGMLEKSQQHLNGELSELKSMVQDQNLSMRQDLNDLNQSFSHFQGRVEGRMDTLKLTIPASIAGTGVLVAIIGLVAKLAGVW